MFRISNSEIRREGRIRVPFVSPCWRERGNRDALFLLVGERDREREREREKEREWKWTLIIYFAVASLSVPMISTAQTTATLAAATSKITVNLIRWWRHWWRWGRWTSGWGFWASKTSNKWLLFVVNGFDNRWMGNEFEQGMKDGRENGLINNYL